VTRALAISVVVLLGCRAPRAPRVTDVELPPVHEVVPQPIVFGPIAEPATAYNQPVAGAVPSTPLRDAVFAALDERVPGIARPLRDPRLDLAGNELADLAERGGVLDAAVVDFAMRARGIVESTERPLVARADTAEGVIAALEPVLGDVLKAGNVRIGVGGGGSAPVVVLVIHAALVTFPPTVPRFAAARANILFRATLDPSLHAPSVTVSHDDDHRAVDHPMIAKLDRWTFETTISCGEHVGTEWVLLEGHDVFDRLTRLALFPIDCGTRPRETYRVEPRVAVVDDPIAIERHLRAVVDRERAAAGLSPLAGDLRLQAAARRTTGLMLQLRTVEHRLAGTTNAQRLREANLVPALAREATLHAPDLETAVEILMNERGYREQLVDPELTHAAVAVAFDAHHEMYIAIELVRIVPPIDTTRLTAAILARINATRPADEQTATDPLLDEIAGRYARERSRGWTDESSMRFVRDDHRFVFGPFATMSRALTLLVTDAPQSVDLGPPTRYDMLGIAAVQSARNGALAGRVWVIVLYARRR
jgi:hypothetical protein